MAHVMETLREDHKNMTQLLDLMESQIAAIRGEQQPNFDLLNEAVSYCLTYPKLYHHPKEDLVYRRLVQMGISPDQVGDMETAHEDLQGLTERLSNLLKKAGAAGDVNRETLASLVDSFIKSYRLHIDAEEKIFFPLAEERFQASDWKAIDAELASMADPLFGDRAPLDYGSLKGALLEAYGRQATGT